MVLDGGDAGNVYRCDACGTVSVISIAQDAARGEAEEAPWLIEAKKFASSQHIPEAIRAVHKANNHMSLAEAKRFVDELVAS